MINANLLITMGVFTILTIIIIILSSGIFLLGNYTRLKYAIIAACAVFLFLLIFSIIFIKSNNKEFYKVTNPDHHTELYKSLEVFQNVCEEYNIKYWAMGGTILGIVRHKAIIPWDDDIDIAIMEEDYNKLDNPEIKEKLNNLGYELYDFNVITTGPMKKIKKINKSGFLIDIFPFTIDNDRYTFLDKKPQKAWPGEYFYKDELFPLTKYKFDTIMIYGPAKPKKFLNRAYPNWKSIRIDFPHENKNMSNMLKLLYNRIGLFP